MFWDFREGKAVKYCKKIKDEEVPDHAPQAWQRVEDYIASHTDAIFSHGVCPGCFDKYKQQNS